MIALMILAAATVYLVIGNFIVKRIPNKWGKGIAIAILILIPTGDSIVGHLYFRYLCSSEAGVKVYQAVELPSEYWDERGVVKFPMIRDNYISSNKEDRYSRFFHIDKDVYGLNDKSGNKLVEDVVFDYWHGWVVRSLSFIAHNTADSCGAGDMKVVFKRVNQNRR